MILFTMLATGAQANSATTQIAGQAEISMNHVNAVTLAIVAVQTWH